MKMTANVTYNLNVTHDELLLICKALGGRLADQHDVERAKYLDREIARMRVSRAEQDNQEMQKLKGNLEG